MRPDDAGPCWRGASGMFLARRRAMIGASLAAMGSLGVVALYQVGLTAHLPDPPLPSFDADSVHGSDEAYLWLGTPDALLGLASYATTAILAAAGGPDRASVQPWIPLALAMKVTVDVATASALTGTALTQQHALSAWSLLVTGATGAMALLVVPEARAALASLYRAGDGRSERKEARTCWIT